MGLADEVRRQQQANAQAASLMKRWEESGFSEDSPVVETPSGDLAAVLNEACTLLPFADQCYRGIAPDGSERVQGGVNLRKQGLFGPKNTTKYVQNSSACFIDLSAQGKDAPNFRIFIFPDGRFAWLKQGSRPRTGDVEEYGNAESVKSAIVKFLARGQ